jgi:predicted nucleic acid-binding Zn ribbon protein
LKKEPDKIGGLISDYLANLGYADRLTKQSAVTEWAGLVGPKIASETQAVRVESDTLIVKVNRAAWRQQLTFLKAELLAKLSSKIGEGQIRDIRFI